MAKKNDDFFKKKKPWSIVKDELLGCYLKPYFQKILYTKRDIIYVDCFAGKGTFEDGNPGSPLIALQTIHECLKQTKVNKWNIKPYFIELNHAMELRESLKEYSSVEIISGKYEEEIEDILRKKKGSNVFLYVDPYGIKSLNCVLFDSFANQGFNSIELLLNMNSFGFIREACRVLGTAIKDESFFEDLVEYDTTQMLANEESKKTLNSIAGGNYWINIIQEYRKGIIDIYEAEKRFVDKYCERLRKSYAYVLNMPLRIKQGQIPKYRMIHATNHADGALLMADNIFGRWELMKDIQSGGQISMFEETPDNAFLNEDEIKRKIIDHVSRVRDFSRLNRVIADFYSVYGVICKTKMVKDTYKNLEKEGKLFIKRTPSISPTGKVSTFFTDETGKIVEVRWNG